MGKDISIDDMIDELKKMLSPRVRSSEEVERRTEVFRETIELLKDRKEEIRRIYG